MKTLNINKFNSFENYNCTIGFEYFNYIIKINNTIIKLQIWDTCSQEIFPSPITYFCRNSSLGIFVYAIEE